MEVEAKRAKVEPLVRVDKAKKKGGSRWKKKNFNRHTAELIATVEQHKDEVSHELRTGGLVSEAADSDIFVEDRAPLLQGKVAEFGRKHQAKLKGQQARAKYYAPPPPAKPIDEVWHPKQTKRNPSKKGNTDLPVAASTANIVTTQSTKAASADGFDLWSTPLEQEFTCTYKPLSRVRGPERVLDKRAVLPPKGGQSYNPEFEEHQRLLREIGGEELQRVETEAKASARLPPKAAMSRAAVEQQMMMQVAKDLENDGNGSSSDDEDNSEEGQVPKGKPTERKTRQQRRRQRLHEKRLRRAKYAKVLRKRNAQFQQLKSINKSINKEEARLNEERIKREKRRLERLAMPRRMAQYAVKAPMEAVKLTDELTPTLRQLKPEGDMLQDRLYSFVRRNIIEYRERASGKTQPKTKTVQSRAVKNFAYQFDARVDDLLS
eukprot:m.164572 g.164572  ORF g.164572 m.164572 type:complete len:434 (-) comp16410_c6_seq3:190-1491(-)